MQKTFISFSLVLTCASFICAQAQEQIEDSSTAPAQPSQAQVAKLSPFPWENWQTLFCSQTQENNKQEVELDSVRLRLDCDSEALYVRFEIPPSLPYELFQVDTAEGEAAWQLNLSMFDPLAQRNEEQENKLLIHFKDNPLRELNLENGIKILETSEADGAERIELRIPRTLAEKQIPWGINGPAIDFHFQATFQLKLPLNEAVVEEQIEGNAPENANEANKNEKPLQALIFTTATKQEGDITRLVSSFQN